MLSTLLPITLLLISSARSQSTKDVAIEIANATLQFKAAEIVPNVIPSLNLTGALNVEFGETKATLGELFSGVEALQTAPTYKVQFSETPESSAKYTVMFVDPSYPGANQDGVTRHMLANDLTYAASGLTNSTPAITEYNAPYPAEGDPAHRYLQLVYLQPSDFKAPSDLSSPQPLQNNWNFQSYVSDTKLDLVAASYIQVTRGTPSKSADATSAVPSASVEALASSLEKSSGTSTSSGPKASNTSSPSGSGNSASTLMVSSSIALVAFGSVFAALF